MEESHELVVFVWLRLFCAGASGEQIPEVVRCFERAIDMVSCPVNQRRVLDMLHVPSASNMPQLGRDPGCPEERAVGPPGEQWKCLTVSDRWWQRARGRLSDCPVAWRVPMVHT